MALKIYKQYGMKLYKLMQENPYKLAEDISGIGFRIADEIASRIGIHTDSDYRIRSGILYTRWFRRGQRACLSAKRAAFREAAALLGLTPEQIEPQLANLAIDKNSSSRKWSLCSASMA